MSINRPRIGPDRRLANHRAGERMRGFSIVELMVAVTLALVVTAAVMAAFLGSRSSFMSTTGTAAVSDSGRFALDFLQTAVRDAGFMACNTTQRQLSLINVGTPILYNFGQPLGGYEAKNTVSGGFTLTAAPTAPPPTGVAVTPDPSAADWLASTGPAWLGGGLDAQLAGKVIKNSDVLVVYSTLRGTQPPAVVSNIAATSAANFTVLNSYNLAPNQLAVISDCAKSVVFQISAAYVPGNTTVPLAGTSMAPGGNSAASLPISFEVGSQVTPVDTTVFYIGAGADGDAALFSVDLNGATAFGTPNELVPDIENMQVLYGVDTTGTQTVSEYVPAQQVIDFNTVMSVKIAVLAASAPGAVPKPAANPTFTLLGNQVQVHADTRSRQVFEITVSTRNLAM